jgi:hypothetical protein
MQSIAILEPQMSLLPYTNQNNPPIAHTSIFSNHYPVANLSLSEEIFVA